MSRFLIANIDRMVTLGLTVAVGPLFRFGMGNDMVPNQKVVGMVTST